MRHLGLKRGGFLAAFALSIIAFSPVPAHAQAVYGTVLGTVTGLHHQYTLAHANHAERDWQCNAAINRDLLGQVLTNLCQQFARAVGFRDIGVAAGSMRFAVVAAQGIGSDSDNRNVFSSGSALMRRVAS